MRAKQLASAIAAIGALCVWSSALVAEEAGQGGKVSLWIFERQVRAVAPGIDRVIQLSDDQKRTLEKVYNEVFSAEPVQAASKVLQNKEAKLSDRQAALKALQEARAAFLKRCGEEVFTAEQNELVKKVYAAYREVRVAAQREMLQKIQADFAGKLDTILNADQKKALEEGRAAIVAAVEAAKKKAAEDKKEADEAKKDG